MDVLAPSARQTHEPRSDRPSRDAIHRRFGSLNNRPAADAAVDQLEEGRSAMTRLHAALLRRRQSHHRWVDERALRHALATAPTEESVHELLSLAAHRA